MVELNEAPSHGRTSLDASLDVNSTADEAFSLLCSVEKWPVWLPFLRSAKPLDSKTALAVGSEVVLRSNVPGEEEHVYEIDRFIANYHLSLVGAYSVRRRLDFRIENRMSRSKLHVKLTYPAYGGHLGAMLGGWKQARKLAAALENGLLHFKGLVEFRTEDGTLTDL